MNKKYTRKQILESIKYWKKQLKMMNESYEVGDGKTPITGKQFVEAVKKAKAEGVKEVDFRYQNPSDQGNGTQPIKIMKWTGENLSDGFQLGISGGSTIGQPHTFFGFLYSLKEMCKKKGKTLSTLCGNAKKIGFSYKCDHDGGGPWPISKDIKFPIVRVQIGSRYSSSELVLFVYILNPNGPGAEKPKSEPDDDSWI